MSGNHFPVSCHSSIILKPAEDYLNLHDCMCILSQIICTSGVVALGILLGGGSLVCLSRGSWAQNDQIQEENSKVDIMSEVEPENQIQFEPVTPPGDPDRGTFSYGDPLTETFIQQLFEDVTLITLNGQAQ